MLHIITFFLGLLLYPQVFNVVGYMYEEELKFDTNLVFCSSLTLLLIVLHDLYIKNTAIYVISIGLTIPTMIFNCYVTHSFYHILLLIIFYLSTATASIFFMKKTIRFPQIFNIKRHLNKLGILYTLTLLIICFSKYGIPNLNFIEVYLTSYEIRKIHSFNGFQGYFLNSLYFILIPCAVYSFRSNNTKLLLFYSASIIAIYGYTGVTNFPITYLFVIGVCFLNKIYKINHSKGIAVLYSFIAISSLTGIDKLIFLYNRAFFTIGANTNYYFDYFRKNEKLNFSFSKLGIFFNNQNTHSKSPGYLIDEVYYSGLGTNQSVGLLGNIYSNIGIIGILFSGILIVLITRIFECRPPLKNLRKDDLLLIFGLLLINISIQQVFLSNGLFFLVFLWVFCFDENSAPYGVRNTKLLVPRKFTSSSRG